VAKQLEEILKGDGPLMQRARTRALQQANASGLQNSTMAATAGEAALYDSAFPIASQDASTYARSGEFNAGAANDFARDFNAFQRSKEQANFNVTANDWANAQEFGRTLIRDNNNNAFVLTRDGKLHAMDLERDAANNRFTLARDDKANAFTLGRDATQNDFTLTRDDKGNAAQLERDKINNAAQLERDRLNIDTATGRDTASVTAREREQASTAVNNARTNYASQLASISANPNMTATVKSQALTDLKTTYNTIIRENAKLLGWDAESWMIGDDSAAPTSVAQIAPPNVIDAIAGNSGYTPP
jgi:hypothetical protein